MINRWKFLGTAQEFAKEVGADAGKQVAVMAVVGVVTATAEWAFHKMQRKPPSDKTDEPPSGPAPQGCGGFD